MNAYVRPKTVEEAMSAMASGPFKILAGGTDIYPGAGQRLAEPVLDVTGISELSGISLGDGLWIGAATTWTQIASASLPSSCRALQQAALEVGGRQIQNIGTIAGNLCNASPAADGVPPLLTLDATVELASPAGRRSVALSEFILGPRKTALGPNEIVTGLRIPATSLSGQSAFSKLGARAYLVISIAMVAARIEVTDGKVKKLAIAVGSCSATASRLTMLEQALEGCAILEIVPKIAAFDFSAMISPITDVRATADYRMQAAKTLVQRTIAKVLA